MKHILFSLGLLYISLPSMAADIIQQRETYQKINQLLSISQDAPTLVIAQGLLPELQDYPLYADAQYQLLKAQKNLLFATIEQYQQAYPNLPFADYLKKHWLQIALEKQDWQEILNLKDKLPQDQASQCIIMHAQQVISDAEKMPQKTTALLEQSLEKLWLTGKNLPNQCAPLFQQHTLSTDLIRQRVLLAIEENNLTLLNQLATYAQEESLRNWINHLMEILPSPLNTWIPQLDPKNPDDKRILFARFPLYVKSLKESAVENPIKLFEQITDWANQFQLNDNERKQWRILYLNQLFDSPAPDFVAWRDQQLTELKDDKLTERRIRLAIRQKEHFNQWLSLLSPETANKDEWQYWLAHISTQEKSQKILTALCHQRGFYGIVACTDLGIPYQPEMRQWKEASPQSNPQGKSQANKPNLIEQYHTHLARITELRHFNEMYKANSEWQHLLQAVDFNAKMQLGQYAEQQGWYDLAVEATIQAKAWGYLRQRLPNAYADWFNLLLKGKNISRTFAMAIARQESAWKSYVASSANARGLMQLLPSTAQLTAQKAQLPYSNESQLYQPFNNIMLGTAHLQELYDKYGDNRILIAAAYNAGSRRVDQWLANSNGTLNMAEFVASIPYFETRGYVQNVLAYDIYYQLLYGDPAQKNLQLFSQPEYNRLY